MVGTAGSAVVGGRFATSSSESVSELEDNDEEEDLALVRRDARGRLSLFFLVFLDLFLVLELLLEALLFLVCKRKYDATFIAYYAVSGAVLCSVKIRLKLHLSE